MKLRNFFCTLFILFFFNGCFSTPKSIQETNINKPLPPWYLTPPNNTQEFLYGLGEATDISKAQKNALENLSQRVTVEISATSEYTLESYTEFREYTSKSSKQNIKSVITPLLIPNYKILQSQKLSNDRYVILISVEKNKLIDNLKNEIAQTYNKVSLEKNTINTKNILKYKYFLQDKSQQLKQYNNKLSILKNLEPNFDISNYLFIQQNFSQELEKLKSSLSFSIQTDENSKPFKSVIENFLIQKGFMKEKNNTPEHIQLLISSTLVENNAYGINIVNAILNIKAISNNKQIGGNTINFKEGSSNNIKDAKQNLINKLQKILIQQEEKEFFGFK